jgi:hypothetical protein
MGITASSHQRITPMTVRLNRNAFEHAKELISQGRFVHDERDDWSEHQPSAQQENEFIARYGFAEFGKWYLGVNDEKPEDTKAHYEFPYGDFEYVYRSGVLTIESRAGQYKHYDIETAAAHLHGMIEAAKDVASSARPKSAARRGGARTPRRSAR